MGSTSQVRSGKKYWSDGTPVAGQQFEYAFDDIGNRISTKAGGNAVGAALRAASYTPNRLNQYTTRTVPGAVDVIGAVKASASVTVNSVAATTRRVEYYHKEVTVANTAADIWQSISVGASEGGNNETLTGNVFIPQTPETNTFDLDGNQETDGRWTYTWDGENRLIRMVANTAVGPQQRIDFEYDWLGRRISKKVWNNTAGTGVPAIEQRFLYDNWNLVAIVDSAFNPTHSFVWGTDLSGSMQGAGGIGGLVSMKVYSGANAGTYFYSYDGNGNIVGLVNAANGSVGAQYEYSAYGEPLRSTGPLAKINPFRFSTKLHDDESDLLYYGYRYYSVSTGRWLSRDPISTWNAPDSAPNSNEIDLWSSDVLSRAVLGQVIAGNAYDFVGNDPLTRTDKNGQTWSGNWNFFWDWATGGGAQRRYYPPGSTESAEMQSSAGGNKLRDDFYAGGCKDFVGGAYGTGEAAVGTLLDPRTANLGSIAAQVGGFAGATATRNGGTVTFCVPNTAGTKSFFYHLVPNVPDQINLPLVGPVNTYGRNIYQKICWTENIDWARCPCALPLLR